MLELLSGRKYLEGLDSGQVNISIILDVLKKEERERESSISLIHHGIRIVAVLDDCWKLYY